MSSYNYGGLVIAALFALIRSPGHTNVLLTNSINTIFSSVIQFSTLFYVPRRVISLSYLICDLSSLLILGQLLLILSFQEKFQSKWIDL